MQTQFRSTLRSLTLPLALVCCGGTLLPTAAVPAARAEFGYGGYASGHGNRTAHTGNQLGRWLGIGWSDGYHTCQPRRTGHHADAPPPTYYDSPAHYGPAHYARQFDDPEYARLPWLAAAKGLPVSPPPVPGSPSVTGQPVSGSPWGPLQR